MDINSWIGPAMGIGIGVILVGVLAIVLSAFKDATNDSTAQTTISNGQTFLSNLTGQFGTIGTVAGVLILFGLVITSGLGGYYLYQRARG